MPGPDALALASPWALLGLLAVPLLAWLYRRRPRLPPQDLPSLVFLQGEQAAPARPQARRVDADLVLACGAVALLALAASGPVLGASPAPVVRVVVSGGVAAAQQGYGARVEAALQEVRAGMAPGMRLEVVRWPDGPGSASLPRPSAPALVARARSGAPARALVVSDVRVGEAEVLARPVGDASLGNVGLVAVARREGGLHVLVRNDSPREARSTLALREADTAGRVLGRWPLVLAPGEVRSLALPGRDPDAGGSLWLEHASPAEDALAADDRVLLSPARLRVHLDGRLPGPVGEAVLAALVAALGRDGVQPVPAGEPCGLRVLPLEGLLEHEQAAPPATLALGVLGEGDPGLEVPAGAEQRSSSELVRDVVLGGAPLRRARLPVGVDEGSIHWLLSRAGVGVVGELPSGAVIACCDLRHGVPPWLAQPSWPLLVDNLVRHLLGTPLEGDPALRVEGLHEAGSTVLGREAQALPPGWLATAPAGAVEGLSLAPGLATAGVLLLALAWWREARRRRLPASR